MGEMLELLERIVTALERIGKEVNLLGYIVEMGIVMLFLPLAGIWYQLRRIR